MILRDLTNSEFQNAKKGKKSTAIIPVGSIEQHGDHLPVSTDTDIISYIAKKIALKTKFFLLPTIQSGVSFEHRPLLNLSISSKTLEKLLLDLCVSLAENGIHKVIILNGHHGNHRVLASIPAKVSKIQKIDLQVKMYSYWHFIEEFDHAGFVETSLMLAISNKVNMKKAKKGLNIDDLSSKKLAKLKKLANKSFIEATKNGIWGDPRGANAKIGRKMLDTIIISLIKECQTWLTDKNPKLHQ